MARGFTQEYLTDYDETFGLKQAARCWFQVFDNVLKEIGFVNSGVDRCIYIIDKQKCIRYATKFNMADLNDI